MGEPRRGPGRDSGPGGIVDLDRDRVLVTRAQSGDESAFDELFILYRKRLRQACLSKLGDADEAEDIAQEAFARAWRALPGFNGERKFYSWLAVIAANLCTDVLRRRTVSSRVSAAVGELELASPDESGEDLIVVAAERELAKRALRCLPQRQKRLIQLREQSGWSYEKIAYHEGLSSNSIETLMSRARQALKREFARLSEADRFSVSVLAGMLSFRLRRLFGALNGARRVGVSSAQHVGYAVAGAAIILSATPIGPFHALAPGGGSSRSQQASGLTGGPGTGDQAVLFYGSSPDTRSGEGRESNSGSLGASLTAEVASPGGWLASLTGGQSYGLMAPFVSVMEDLGGTVKGVESTFTRVADRLDGAVPTVRLALGGVFELGTSRATAPTPGAGSTTSDPSTSSDEDAQATQSSQTSTQSSASPSNSPQQAPAGASGGQYPGYYYGYDGNQTNYLGSPDGSDAQPAPGTSPSASPSQQQDTWTGAGTGSGSTAQEPPGS